MNSRRYPGTGEGLGAAAPRISRPVGHVGYYAPGQTGGGPPGQHVSDTGADIPAEFVRNELLMIAERLSDFLEFFSEQTRNVDEYQPGSGVAVSVTNVTLQAEYDLLPVKISTVLVTGPAATAFTLKLGRRYWSTLVTDARGVWQVTSLSLELGRSDDRILNSATAGNWTLELMGTADTGTSYRYK